MGNVIVIGAGLAGTLAALEVAKKHSVTLIDAGESIIPLRSTSQNECFKIHTGMHYLADKKTAEVCLTKAIEFLKQYPNYISGSGQTNNPLLRSRHYVLKDSVVPLKKTEETINYLRKVYSDLIKKDPKNKVLGDPDDFIKKLVKNEYSYISENIPYQDKNGKQQITKVNKAYEAAEPQLNMVAFKKFLEKEVKSNKNIRFIPNTKVTHVGLDPKQSGYIVSTRDKNNQHKTISASSIVNCAWQNIENLDKSTGNFIPAKKGDVRVKVSIVIDLPEEMRGLNPSLFSVGPFFSIHPQPNGTAILTSERVTNVGHFKSGDNVPEHIQNVLKNLRPDTKIGQELVQGILNDCAKCFTNKQQKRLQEAKILDLRAGFVKMPHAKKAYSKKTLYSKDSSIHKRIASGVTHKALGYLSNASMKMTYAPANAKEVSDILERDLKIQNEFNRFSQKLLQEFSKPFLKLNKTILPSLINIRFRDEIVKKMIRAKAKNKPLNPKILAQDIETRVIIKSSVCEEIKIKLKNLKDIKMETKPLNDKFNP